MSTREEMNLDMKDYVRNCLQSEFLFLRPIDILLYLQPHLDFSDCESHEILSSLMYGGPTIASKNLMDLILSKELKDDHLNKRWFYTLEDALSIHGERYTLTLLNNDKTSKSYKDSIKFFNLFRGMIVIDTVIDIHQLVLKMKVLEKPPEIRFLDDEIFSNISPNRPGSRGVKLAFFLQQIQMKCNFNWIPYFCYALKELKHLDILRQIDPALIHPKTLEEMKDTYNVVVDTQFGQSSPEDEQRVGSYKTIDDDEPIAILGEYEEQSDEPMLEGASPTKRHCKTQAEEAETMDLNIPQSAETDGESRVPIEKIEDVIEEKKDINISSDCQTVITETTDSNIPITRKSEEIIVERESLVLRNYQKEYAETALQGFNTLIVAPTGTGKTHIAMYIVKEHLDQDPIENTVVVVASTVALVDQHEREFKKFLHEYSTSIAAFHGSKADSLTVTNSLENKILITTPQMLLNDLTNRENKISLSDHFSMIIFDECHHCLKGHPYAKIMDIYHEEKERNDNEHSTQIVGLTASPPLQKAKNMTDAKDAIFELCAYLDIKKVPVIRENVDEFKQFINNVTEDILDVPPREIDSFGDIIKELMTGIENLWNEKRNSSRNSQFQHDLSSLANFPSEKGSDIYTSWIGTSMSTISRIRDVEIREFYYTAKIFLSHYNTALLMHRDLNPKDCLAYLKKELLSQDLKKSESEKQWIADFQNSLLELETIAEDPKNLNPKLLKLKEVLRTNRCERSIIFAKTRIVIDFLVTWINEDQQLSHLNANKLVGSKSSDLGMSHKQQEDVLRYFKEGRHKVLVSSSVGEEGLDISKCGLVITYEHVSEMKAMIQRRGRGRAANSKYFLITSTTNNNYQKEKINMMREKFLKKCIDHLATEEGKYEFGIKIPKVQNRMNTDRKLKRFQSNAIITPDEKVYEFRCIKCESIACLSSDLRLVGNSHRVILLRDFETRYVLKEHPRKENTRGNIHRIGKIHCKECEANWGVLINHEGIELPVLKVDPFVINDISTTTDTSESFIKTDDGDSKSLIQRKEGIRKSTRIASGKVKPAWPSNCTTCSSCSEKENTSSSNSVNWSSVNINKCASQSSEDSLFAFKPKESKPKKKGRKSTNRKQTKKTGPVKNIAEKQKPVSPPKEPVINFSEFDSYSLNIESYEPPKPNTNTSCDYRCSPAPINASLTQARRIELESISSTLTCSTPVNDRTLFKREDDQEEVNISIIEYDEEEIYRGEVFDDPVINLSKNANNSPNDEKPKTDNKLSSLDKAGTSSSKTSSEDTSKFLSCSPHGTGISLESSKSENKSELKLSVMKESNASSSSSSVSAGSLSHSENQKSPIPKTNISQSLPINESKVQITEPNIGISHTSIEQSTAELSIFGSPERGGYNSSQDLFSTPPEEMQIGRRSNDELTESEYKIKAYYESFNQNYMAQLKQQRLTECLSSPSQIVGNIYGIRESENSIRSNCITDSEITVNSQSIIDVDKIDESKASSIPLKDVESLDKNETILSEESVTNESQELKSNLHSHRKLSERFHRLTVHCTPHKTSLSLFEVFSPVRNLAGEEISDKEKLLLCCEQEDVLSFDKCMTKRMLKECVKLGEGVYGEVFMAPRGKSKSAIKVIPVSGTEMINGELPKSFTDICAEIVISRELSNLDNMNEFSSTPGFCKLKKASLVQGPYPEQFLQQWLNFADANGTENDCPDEFPEDQHYVVLEYEESGKTLESKIFKNAWQVYAIFEQTVLSLAVAEDRLEFEHRDLHWGNVLVREERKKNLQFRLKNNNITVLSRGIKVTIIDYTLSRLTQDGQNVYSDISTDEELFTGVGDLQFEIYRMMREHNENEWEWFRPKTNVYWLYYLIEMFDLKTRKVFLKRCKADNIRMEHLYVGSTVNMLSRQLNIVDIGDGYTRNKIASKNERTLAMIKPDAVSNVGAIMDLIQQNGFLICNLKMLNLTKDEAATFYTEHRSKPFFNTLINYMSNGKIIVMELMASDAVARWRQLMGPTDSAEARSMAATSIRARFGRDQTMNACHGSDSVESAARELEFFFPASGRDSFRSTATFCDATCCIIKPHAVVEGQSGAIIEKIQSAGFEISAMQIFHIEKANAEEFLEVYKGVVSEYAAMVGEFCSGPCIVLEVRAQNAQQTFREFTGPADPEIARHLRPRTLRATFGKDKIQNAVHCTDLADDALLELEYFYKILMK
ncbi:DgyrCDS6915 [Dimorphilus gyrociliatus]|uniref:RNA helicase n=1 Tax=Dimorphilus gyrociliatus TaxID=2664684 RepID=A0A7I8VQ27_9ANNE|nr:DgyrCDS6915 [Dimorphilus gyrociliatus]